MRVSAAARVHIAYGRLMVAQGGGGADAGALAAWERAVTLLVGVSFTVDTCASVLVASSRGALLFVGPPEASHKVLVKHRAHKTRSTHKMSNWGRCRIRLDGV